MTLRPRRILPLAMLVLSGVVAACVDESVVYRDRELLEGVPSGVGGFVGYQAGDTSQTVCGNCHVGQDREWRRTAHANAWATLVASGRAQPFCEGCHTVTQRGNHVTDSAVAYNVTRSSRYYDVQCESCHGPGEPHIRNPDATQPLASIHVEIGGNNGCGECHNGIHHPFVEEWSQSRHGRVLASPAGQAACQGCHTGQGALRAFGVNAEYVEKNSATHEPITCAVCHDPHDPEHAGQLRYSISIPNEEENLCMRCHHKRGSPDLSATGRGPHSPEGPLLLGEAGWWPPNMPVEPGSRIVGTHGSERNPRLCAGCHLYRFDVPDQATSGFVVSSVGHMFQAIPCLDAQGRPRPGDVDCPLEQRSFRSCTQSGCHGSENAARSAYLTASTRLANLAAQLNAQLARVPASEFDANDNRYSTAEGARFNAQLALRVGTAAHNPFLTEALLLASIEQVRRDYGVSPAAGADLRARMMQME